MRNLLIAICTIVVFVEIAGLVQSGIGEKPSATVTALLEPPPRTLESPKKNGYFLLLGFSVWAALALGAHPVGLLLGLSLVVPGVVLAAWRARPAPSPDAPALAADDPSWEAWNPWLARERDPAADEDAS